jgi:hypothetical protein
VAKRDASTFAFNARHKIAQDLRALAIFSVPRSSAILNYFAVLEVKFGIFSLDSTIAMFGAHREAVESSMYALPAIFEQCPPDESMPSQTITEETYKQAYDLFTFTQKYAQVDYCYTLAERGNFEISVAKKDRRITFSYASSEADQADTSGRAREMLPKFSEERSSLDQGLFSEISQRLRGALSAQNLLTNPETCEYVVSDDVLSVIRDLAEAFFQRMPVRMDSQVKVGEVTFGDFRSFWSALLSVIEMHWMAHTLACGGDLKRLPIKTIVIKKQRTEMATLISSIARLSYRAAEFILGCYLYDPRINGNGPICQPIVPITGDNVCFSSLILSHFDFERNFFKLLNRSPSLLPFAPSINSQKEPIAIRHLSTLFPKSDYATKDCVPIPGPKRTDADLLVYEHRSGFTLVIQHKWLTAPETPEESSSNDDYLKKGVTQGITARDYFRSDRTFVRDTLKLSATAPIHRIECVTVCRGLEGSGFMERSDVPVVAEQAFETLLKQAEGLERLWAALLTRPDKALAAERAVDGKMTIQLGEYKFVMPALSF